jgi:hypothetical protein
MRLESSAFSANDMIPVKYTCDGEDISPPLKWQGAPESAKSFALSCLDPDAPGTTFVHWLICNIPKDVDSIQETGPVPEAAKEIENDFRRTSYGGPCPPSGKHRYIFTLYALDVETLEDINKSNFLSKVEEHTLDSAELTGLYKRG